MSEDPFTALLETARLLLEVGRGKRILVEGDPADRPGLTGASKEEEQAQSNSDQSNATNVSNPVALQQRERSGRLRRPSQRQRESADLQLDPQDGMMGWDGPKPPDEAYVSHATAVESPFKESMRGAKTLQHAGSNASASLLLMPQPVPPHQAQQLLMPPFNVPAAPLLMAPQPQHTGYQYDNVFTGLFSGDGAATDDDEGFTPRARKNSAPKNNTVPGGPCAHCGTMESPQWRRPLTRNIALCNACGIYYSRHQALPKRKKVKTEAAAAAAGTGSDGESGPADERAASPHPPSMHRQQQQAALHAAVLLHRVASGSLPAAGRSTSGSASGRCSPASAKASGAPRSSQRAGAGPGEDARQRGSLLDGDGKHGDGDGGVECDEELDEGMHFGGLPEGVDAAQLHALLLQQQQQQQLLLQSGAMGMSVGFDGPLGGLPSLAAAGLLPAQAAMGLGLGGVAMGLAPVGLGAPLVSPSRQLLAAASALNSPKKMLAAGALQLAPCRPSIALQVKSRTACMHVRCA